MEFNFSPLRTIILMSLILLFYCLGGFEAPQFASDSAFVTGRVRKSWFICILLFLTGAVCFTIVDHFTGTIDRTNLRFLYIILGIMLMLGSLIYLNSIKEAVL